ncbi:MAG: hypothetical protein LAT84_08520 [Balneolia bacterium]|nr:hypothetical protein [Balneolia bacterium]
MTKPDDCLFVLNPNAGGGKAGRFWEVITSEYPSVATSTLKCDNHASLARKLKETLKPNIKRVIAVGGDGSVHQLINAVIALGLESELAVGLIPAGSGSDLRRNLGIPNIKDPAALFQRVMRSETRSTGLIKVEHDEGVFYSVNICSVGISANVAEAVNSGVSGSNKNYIRTALKLLLHWKGVHAGTNLTDAAIDPETFDLILFANGSYFGNGIQIMPGASVFDSEIRLLIVRKQQLHKLMTAITLLPFGKHTFLSGIEQNTLTGTAKIAAAVNKTLLMEADGELYSSGSFRISLAPDAIRLLC